MALAHEMDADGWKGELMTSLAVCLAKEGVDGVVHQNHQPFHSCCFVCYKGLTHSPYVVWFISCLTHVIEFGLRFFLMCCERIRSCCCAILLQTKGAKKATDL